MSTKDGGRKSPVSSGFRPNHVFEYQSNDQFQFAFVGDIQLNGDNLMMPGEIKEVTVSFLSNQPIDKYLNIGRKWNIHEGGREIGKAEILEISI
ncbi:hypothetical protein [Winogradskyella sp. R77965]|uniref:hypothetical protein n=1 Tax=Winogradskyella sp. R77965 TaxID=3093872 RepID=UPI0037DD101A